MIDLLINHLLTFTLNLSTFLYFRFIEFSVVHFVKRRAFLYVVAQSAGALVGAGTLELMRFADGVDKAMCTWGPCKGMSLGQLIGYEIISSFVLVMTVFATRDSLRSAFGGLGPLAIGLSVSMCHLWAVRRPTY